METECTLSVQRFKHSEMNQSSTRPPPYSFHIYFNVILPNIPRSTKWSVSLELHVYKLLSRRTYTTASNTSLLILHVSIREL